MKMWTGFYGQRLGSAAGFCAHFDELCSFVKEGIPDIYVTASF
jgi:hypothetical protein